MKIVVAVTLYNSADVIKKTLDSIRMQKYDNFICYITNDLSTDRSAEVVNNFIKETGDDRFRLINNEKKRYQAGNYDLICRDMEDVNEDDICVEVDGDDWLPDNEVFDRVIKHFSKGDIWLANGNFVYSHGRKGFSQKVTNLQNLRRGAFTMSHLRCWKVFLWRAMPQSDLKDENGNWWSAACDTIFMYDMMEMAGLEHYTYMPETNYVYNDGNPLNEHKQMMPKIIKMNTFVRNKKPRKKLKR